MKYTLIGTVVLMLFLSVLFIIRFAPEPVLTDPSAGEIHFGFVREVGNSESGYAILFDEATWLTGKEGEDAAIAAGACTEATRLECLPNDFFILNEATTTTPVQLDGEVVIAMATLTMEAQGIKETQVTPQQFMDLINDSKLNWQSVPYQMLVVDGKVTILEEVYVP